MLGFQIFHDHKDVYHRGGLQEIYIASIPIMLDILSPRE